MTAEASLTCAFCRHIEYIADERRHFCMVCKTYVYPEQPACNLAPSTPKQSHFNK